MMGSVAVGARREVNNPIAHPAIITAVPWQVKHLRRPVRFATFAFALPRDRIIRGRAYAANPRLMGESTQRRLGEVGLHRAICNYIAGMTDRFAIEEYKRICRQVKGD
jgi:hypothetical protein